MTRKTLMTKTRALWVATALITGAPVALAQETGSGQLEQGSATSDKEKTEFADSAIAEMNEAVRSVSKKLESAEKEGDDLKIQCLSKKLSSIQALAEVSADAKDAMEGDIANADAIQADHEFRKLAVALSKVRQFQAEAEACVGDSDTTPGVTDVNVSVDGVTGANETELMDDSDFDIGTTPPNTSPFQ